MAMRVVMQSRLSLGSISAGCILLNTALCRFPSLPCKHAAVSRSCKLLRKMLEALSLQRWALNKVCHRLRVISAPDQLVVADTPALVYLAAHS